MKKFISTLSVIILSLFVLAVFGWMSVQLSKKKKDFGVLNEPIRFMYSFLDQFGKSVEEAKKVSPTFLDYWAKVEPINKLDFDFKILTSYSLNNQTREVAIKNLKTGQVEYKWDIKEKGSRWDRIVNPYMLPNKDLIYFYTDKTGLRRIDSLGNVKWKQDKFLAHHALNVDSAGNFWVCSKNPPKRSPWGTYKINGRSVYYDDDYITKVDAENGEVLFHKSVTEILKENKLEGYLLQASTAVDPIHLNDVQPALKTTKYYNEGDVFLSVKQSSILVHYRPETNQIIKIIEGPFSAQHDIDFYNDSVLTIFNNNSYIKWTTASKPKPKHELNKAGNFYSNIARYSFKTGKISFIGDSTFRVNQIFTSTEGLHEFINDSTYFIEEQNIVFYWVIQNDKVLFKKQLESVKEGYCDLPNWARVVSN